MGNSCHLLLPFIPGKSTPPPREPVISISAQQASEDESFSKSGSASTIYYTEEYTVLRKNEPDHTKNVRFNDNLDIVEQTNSVPLPSSGGAFSAPDSDEDLEEGSPIVPFNTHLFPSCNSVLTTLPTNDGSFSAPSSDEDDASPEHSGGATQPTEKGEVKADQHSTCILKIPVPPSCDRGGKTNPRFIASKKLNNPQL